MSRITLSALHTPVVLIIFNRPDLVRQVWSVLRTARPDRLFVVADGPRSDHPDDSAQCAACRAIVEEVDWPCQVTRHYADDNLNCGIRVASGLDWVFAQVDEAIILEDDILPDLSFFGFCQDLLGRYRHDERIMGIGGCNLLGEWRRNDGSYFFHRQPFTWGWATWARAWRHFDYTLERYRAWDVHERLAAHLATPVEVAYFWTLFQHLQPAPFDAWDTQWILICILLGGYWISPTMNLITNLGFSAEATHTAMAHDLRGQIRRGSLTQPLIAPPGASEPGIDTLFDRWSFLLQTLNSYKDIRALYLWQRALETNPQLAMPGDFRRGRSTLAPLRDPTELLAVLDYVTPFLADNPRLPRMKVDLTAIMEPA